LEYKKGGVHKMDAENMLFKETMEKSRLINLPSKGGRFTWSNRRGGSKKVVECLDRFLVSKTLFKLKQVVAIEIKPFYGSHHCPISLCSEISMTPYPKPFRSEKF
jgi:hypothetical protein